MRSYDMDLKTRVIEYYQNTNYSYRNVSLIFGVSKSSIWRWLNKNDEPRDSNNKKIIELIRDKLENGWTGKIKDIVQMIKIQLKINKSISTIWRVIRKLGYKLVLDNLRAHHNKDFKEKLKKIGLCGEWLPPYSPDLNPIEEVFGWIKRELRYKIIKNEKELLLEVKKLVNKINEKGTLNYYKHSYD